MSLKEVRAVVDTAERHADGLATDHEHESAYRKGVIAVTGAIHRNVMKMDNPVIAEKTRRMACAVNASHSGPFNAKLLYGIGKDDEFLRQTAPVVLRCVVGNPFRPVTIHPDWSTWNNGTVPNLAQTIYDDRRFDLLPILADALEEAGCDSADILAHCRGPGPHVRGCWVVDLLLEKS